MGSVVDEPNVIQFVYYSLKSVGQSGRFVIHPFLLYFCNNVCISWCYRSICLRSVWIVQCVLPYSLSNSDFFFINCQHASHASIMFVEPRANYVRYDSCWKKETDKMKLFDVWLTVNEKEGKLKSKKCAIKKAMVEWIFFPLFGNTPKSIKSNINVTWHVCIYIKMKNDTGLRHVAYPHTDIHSEWEKKNIHKSNNMDFKV